MKFSIIQYILRRLTEGSTLRNLVLFICSFSGLTLSDQQTNATVFIIMGIIGFLGVALPDNLYDLKRDTKKDTPDIGYNDRQSETILTDRDVISDERMQSYTTSVQTSGKLGRTNPEDLSEFTSVFNDK